MSGADTRPAGAGICYVLDRFPVLSQTFVSNEVAELRRLGHEVGVVTARPPVRHWTAADDLGSPGRRQGGNAALAHLRVLARRPRRYLAYLRVLAEVPLRDAAFALWAPQVAVDPGLAPGALLHTHFAFRGASFARALAALTGSPRSVTTHANDLFTQERHLPARLAGARVLTISAFNQRFLRERGVASEVSHCGVDPAALTERAAQAAQADVPAYDVAFVGRLVEKKGPLAFVEAVARLQAATDAPVRAVMVGDGPLLEDCRRLAARLQSPVELVGACPPDRTLAVLSRARCLCLPARRDTGGDQDGIPVVLMEAMALGTPVVTTAVSGIPELVAPDAGWVLDPGLPDLPGHLALALGQCLAERLSDPARARWRADRARDIVAHGFTLRGQASAVAATAAGASTRSVAR